MKIGVEYTGDELLELIWKDLKEKFPGRVGDLTSLEVVDTPVLGVALKLTLLRESDKLVPSPPAPVPSPTPLDPPPPRAPLPDEIPGVDYSLEGDPRDVIVPLPARPVDHSLREFDPYRLQDTHGINGWGPR